MRKNMGNFCSGFGKKKRKLGQCVHCKLLWWSKWCSVLIFYATIHHGAQSMSWAINGWTFTINHSALWGVGLNIQLKGLKPLERWGKENEVMMDWLAWHELHPGGSVEHVECGQKFWTEEGNTCRKSNCFLSKATEKDTRWNLNFWQTMTS